MLVTGKCHTGGFAGWVWSPSSTLQTAVPITGVMISKTANFQIYWALVETLLQSWEKRPETGTCCWEDGFHSPSGFWAVWGNWHCHCMLPCSSLLCKWAVSVPEAVSLLPSTASVLKHIVKYTKGIMSFTFLVENTIFLLIISVKPGLP